jgi:hypothetical protein
MVRRGKYTVNAGPKRHTRKRIVLTGGTTNIRNQMVKFMEKNTTPQQQQKISLPMNNETRNPSNNKGMSHANAFNYVHGPKGNPLARLSEKKAAKYWKKKMNTQNRARLTEYQNSLMTYLQNPSNYLEPIEPTIFENLPIT